MWLYDGKERRCSHYDIKEKDTLIVDTEFMGKGLIANECIDKGEYIVPYEGEILFHRPQHNSEYVVEIRLAVDDKRRSQKCYIDAKNSSSKGRYVNHACENNAVIYKVMKAGCDIPKLWIKAIKNIVVGEEILVNYGPDMELMLSNMGGCLCMRCRNGN